MLFDPLPSNLVMPRPQLPGTYDPAEMDRLDKRSELIIQRWYEGLPLIAEICSARRIRLYTATMQEIDSRLDYVREELMELPVGTVLVGRATIPGRGRDVAVTVAQGTHRDASILLGQGLLLEFRVSAMPYFGGRPLSEWPYWQMYLMLKSTIPSDRYVRRAERWAAPLSEVKARMRQAGWKGLVAISGSYRYQPVRGVFPEPPRPPGCWIWKPSK